MTNQDRLQQPPQERIPPYVPYSTWRTLLEGLKRGVPQRIDKSYLSRYRFSLSAQSMLLIALRFFGLVNHNGYTNNSLEHLAGLQGTPYRDFLSSLVHRSYGPLISDIDLRLATPDMLRERFASVGAKGDVARKCVTFFVAIAREAGIPLSPHIQRRRRQPGLPQTPKGTPSSSSAQKSRRSKAPSLPTHAITPLSPAVSGLASLVAQKFPPFDPQWDEPTTARWRETFVQLLRLVLEQGNGGQRAPGL